MSEVLVAMVLVCSISLVMAKSSWQASRILDETNTVISTLQEAENAHEQHGAM